MIVIDENYHVVVKEANKEPQFFDLNEQQIEVLKSWLSEDKPKQVEKGIKKKKIKAFLEYDFSRGCVLCQIQDKHVTLYLRHVTENLKGKGHLMNYCPSKVEVSQIEQHILPDTFNSYSDKSPFMFTLTFDLNGSSVTANFINDERYP